MSMIPSTRMLESETHMHPRVQDRPLGYQACKHTTGESSWVKICVGELRSCSQQQDDKRVPPSIFARYAAPDIMEQFEARKSKRDGDDDDDDDARKNPVVVLKRLSAWMESDIYLTLRWWFFGNFYGLL